MEIIISIIQTINSLTANFLTLISIFIAFLSFIVSIITIYFLYQTLKQTNETIKVQNKSIEENSNIYYNSIIIERMATLENYLNKLYDDFNNNSHRQTDRDSLRGDKITTSFGMQGLNAYQEYVQLKIVKYSDTSYHIFNTPYPLGLIRIFNSFSNIAKELNDLEFNKSSDKKVLKEYKNNVKTKFYNFGKDLLSRIAPNIGNFKENLIAAQMKKGIAISNNWHAYDELIKAVADYNNIMKTYKEELNIID